MLEATADALPGAAAGADPIREGDLVAGRFRIGRRLGVGGMGVVVAATDLERGEDVALKFLRRDVDTPSVDRFLREARAASSLRNVHVTRVLDVGQLESGMPFIVMEQLHGKTLAEVAAAGTIMSVEEVVRCALHACEGLADAHAHGIVHRDLKPANLFLTTDPDGAPLLKVLDFGVSKFMSEQVDAGVTTTGNMVGSPSFAAPEQLVNPKSVGPGVDVWSLGVTLYFLLGRELPFSGETRVQVCMLVVTSTPVPLRELRPELPQALTDAVMRCLEKEPADRYANVADLARSLMPFAPSACAGAAERIAELLSQSGPVVAPPLSVRPAEARVPMPLRVSSAAPYASASVQPMQPSRSRARTRTGIALVSLLALAGAVFAFTRHGTPSGASVSEPRPLPGDEALPSAEARPAAESTTAASASASTPSLPISGPATPTKPRRPLGREPPRNPRSYR